MVRLSTEVKGLAHDETRASLCHAATIGSGARKTKRRRGRQSDGRACSCSTPSPPHGDGYVGNKAHSIHIHIGIHTAIPSGTLAHAPTPTRLHNMSSVPGQSLFEPFTSVHAHRECARWVGDGMACRRTLADNFSGAPGLRRCSHPARGCCPTGDRQTSNSVRLDTHTHTHTLNKREGEGAGLRGQWSAPSHALSAHRTLSRCTMRPRRLWAQRVAYSAHSAAHSAHSRVPRKGRRSVQ